MFQFRLFRGIWGETTPPPRLPRFPAAPRFLSLSPLLLVMICAVFRGEICAASRSRVQGLELSCRHWRFADALVTSSVARGKALPIRAEDARAERLAGTAEKDPRGDAEAGTRGALRREMFPPGFLFGTATAAYQVEGGAWEGGRGASIWDVFAHTPGRTHNGDTGDVACDQYHRYEEDVALMRQVGFSAYRFSISWSRILPSGRQPVNEEGIDYYNRLIDCLLRNGITPCVTLFHWDLPQALEEEFGGFRGEAIVAAFRDFASLCFSLFGDRVSHWLTFNEPYTFATKGYAVGDFAPGRCSDRQCCAEGDGAVEPYVVVHHMLLAHAAAVDCYRREFQPHQGGQIGIAVDSEWAEPFSQHPDDVAAADRRMQFNLGWLLHPIFFGAYPPAMRHYVGPRLPSFSPLQAASLKGSVDFVGLNHYTSRYIAHADAGDGGEKGRLWSYFDDQHVAVLVLPTCHSPTPPILHPCPISLLLSFLNALHQLHMASPATHGFTPCAPACSPLYPDQCTHANLSPAGGITMVVRVEVPESTPQPAHPLSPPFPLPMHTYQPASRQAASPWLYEVPWGFQKLLMHITATYGAPPIYITENGLDEEDDPSLPLHVATSDQHRICYYHAYISHLLNAIGQGADVRGYMAWSWMDNFEWQMGYSRRFGLVHVDRNTHILKRTPKASALWWQRLLSGMAVYQP
ncbi:unnamed protein product [Closterium sp. Yama58-4]|nr:unnamed protein product [Closterium sp. Yama58-4]